MPRRSSGSSKRTWPADSVYNSVLVTRFINNLMKNGEKSKAQKIFYSSMEIIKEKTNQNPLKIFQQAIKNVAPLVEVWPRRIGGATFLVPRQVATERRISKAIKWIINSARIKKGKSMREKLAEEIIAASQEEGDAYKRKVELHKTAEANKAFAHFGWWGRKKN
ncbi:MAG: 30S ribosomal protein S7 [Candidatus Parcubacteria bacterium]|nr:MAG: 30S ribosomal protein S7 [Candidatus Parcubacteria bacterium]